MRALSPNAILSANELNTDNAFLFLVQIRSELPEIYRFVNNTENIMVQGQEFLAYPLDITLAMDDGQTIPDVSIRFDNVEQDLIDIIRGLVNAPRLDLYLVLTNDPDTIEMALEDLMMVDIEFDGQSISARLLAGDLLNSPYPCASYEASQFPTLFY